MTILPKFGFKYLPMPKGKVKEIYLYQEESTVIMGFRGGKEYRMNSRDFNREILRLRLDLRPDNYEKLIEIVIRESQYTEFEAVKPEILMLK